MQPLSKQRDILVEFVVALHVLIGAGVGCFYLLIYGLLNDRWPPSVTVVY
jgi:hypothetical protein